MKFEVASLSHTGQVRENNEDAYLAFEPTDDASIDTKGRLYLVADGMGGHKGGEIASSIAVDAIRSAYYESSDSEAVAALVGSKVAPTTH